MNNKNKVSIDKYVSISDIREICITDFSTNISIIKNRKNNFDIYLDTSKRAEIN